MGKNTELNQYEPVKYSNEEIKDISKLIKDYSPIYQRFEDMQKGKKDTKKLLPDCDQKTGAIGEYYSALYVQKKYEVSTTYAKSGSVYDIEYIRNGKLQRIQVKTVSAHSTTRRISPIKYGDWNELYLISLDEFFKPNGFWIKQKKDLKFPVNKVGQKIIKEAIKYVTMPKEKDKSMKGKFDFGYNLIDDFLKYV